MSSPTETDGAREEEPKKDESKGAPPAAGADGAAESGSENMAGYSKEVLDLSGIDPVLAEKMALVNTAIDEIGMTSFQWKLFFLNGFGYAVDSVREPISPESRSLLRYPPPLPPMSFPPRGYPSGNLSLLNPACNPSCSLSVIPLPSRRWIRNSEGRTSGLPVSHLPLRSAC